MQPESTWTPPSEWCPHPEHWHSEDCDSAETEVTELVGALVIALQPGLVVETGTAWGQTAKKIGQCLARNGHGRLITFETDWERYDHSRVLCEDLPVDLWYESSLNWSPDAPIDFAWFDSIGSQRLAEFERYLPWIKPGSIVGFHDTAPHQKIGKSIMAHPRLTCINLHTPRGVILAQVS